MKTKKLNFNLSFIFCIKPETHLEPSETFHDVKAHDFKIWLKGIIVWSHTEPSVTLILIHFWRFFIFWRFKCGNFPLLYAFMKNFPPIFTKFWLTMKRRAPPDQNWASLNNLLIKLENVMTWKLFIAKNCQQTSRRA